MPAHTPSRLLACAALAASLAACGGGQASLPPGPPGLTPAANSNALTTYSVFVGQSNGESIVDVVPFGQSSTLAGAVRATSASVVYPDGSSTRKATSTPRNPRGPKPTSTRSSPIPVTNRWSTCTQMFPAPRPIPRSSR